jgi:hypothetical protein
MFGSVDTDPGAEERIARSHPLNTQQDLVKKSSAVTLSDMEMFIFPELIYSLVLANIMSPRIWRWREDPWFDGLERMKPYRRITRLKQFIMDHYIFNLDLDTWGLTTKDREMARFDSFISADTLARSNALFGYEGDKYYFDIDIRTHFGLDKYEGDVIPYWKTETVEAMDAFQYRPDYETGAGECVSLATLYAAALFVIARIPLEDIYLMATPLHSQNFIDVNEGVLTNNRRLVTKNMWYNGTPLSAQARRALENERVTIVAHSTGCVHAVYSEASIAADAYEHFSARMRDYLFTPLTDEILGNFLRQNRELQKCFQLRFTKHGIDHYVAMERLFAYEHGSPYLVTDNTRDKLLRDVEGEELMHDPIAGRIVFNDVEAFIKDRHLDMRNPEHTSSLKQQFSHDCIDSHAALDQLIHFCYVDPRLPVAEHKRFLTGAVPLGLELEMTREEIEERLESIREKNKMADLAFYAYRDIRRTQPEPFLLASVQRNPVSVVATAGMTTDEMVQTITDLADESIYDGAGRLAQPDEVWNYARGDGIEKALLLANLLRARDPEAELTVSVSPERAVLQMGTEKWTFASAKDISEAVWSVPGQANT